MDDPIGLVVHVETGAWLDGQLGVGGDDQAVVDEVGFVGREDGVAVERLPAFIEMDILPIRFQQDGLPVAVDLEQDGVLDQERLVAAVRVDRHFHEDVHAVSLEDVDAVEGAAFPPVDVDAEARRLAAGQEDGLDAQGLVVGVVDHQLFGRRADGRENGVEGERIGRERQAIGGIRGVVVVQPVARRQRQRDQTEKPKEYVCVCFHLYAFYV